MFNIFKNRFNPLWLSQGRKTGEININVLGYQEDNQWVALALEMDLRGYANSWPEAVRELKEMIDTQIGFAISKNQPEMIFFPAEKMYFEMFSRVIAMSFGQFAQELPETSELEITALPIPQPHVIEKIRGGFGSGHGQTS